MKLRGAVIGCGRIGSHYDDERMGKDPLSHAGAYDAAVDVELVAGIDSSPEQRRDFERRWGKPAFPSVDDMLAADVQPDIWSIATPSESHLEYARRAIDAGARAIWCEKPIASSSQQGEEMVGLAKKAGVPLAVNYWRRWDAAHRRAAQWLHEGHLGRIQHVAVHYARGVRNYGTHAFDLLRWFVGEFEWALAVPAVKGEDPSPAALLGLKGGAIAAMLPVERSAYDLFEISIFGTEGRVALRQNGLALSLTPVVEDTEWHEPRILSAVEQPFDRASPDAMVAAAQNLAAAVFGQASVGCTGEDGVAALRVAEAIEQSLLSGGPTQLSPKV